MNIEEVSKFLGQPAQSKEFDQYLTAQGISHRPVFSETPVDDISIKNEGISLVFSTAHRYEKTHGIRHEGPSMIFSSIQVYGAVNDSEFVQYPGPLPYGLSFQSTSTEAVNFFGSPTVSYKFGENQSHVWYNHQGNTIGITFLPDNQGISWLELSKAANEPPVQIEWD